MSLLILCHSKTAIKINSKTDSTIVKNNKINMISTLENLIDSHSQKISHLPLKANSKIEVDSILMPPVTFLLS